MDHLQRETENDKTIILEELCKFAPCISMYALPPAPLLLLQFIYYIGIKQGNAITTLTCHSYVS